MEPSRWTVEHVRARLEQEAAPLFVDARAAGAWAKSGETIPNAIRVPPDDVPAHLDEIPKGRPIVTFCT